MAERAITAAARDVLAERRRQIEVEGWTSAHDDEHVLGEMAMAAVAYASSAVAAARLVGDGYAAGESDAAISRCRPPATWPFAAQWWKPVSRRRSLVKAAALILAEIERLDRAEGQSNG